MNKEEKEQLVMPCTDLMLWCLERYCNGFDLDIKIDKRTVNCHFEFEIDLNNQEDK